MPSLSINKSDLEDLGISLKDILAAISRSKKSGDDVIKIKKRKKVKKKKVKKNPQVQSQTQSQLKPFPNQTAAGGGGGGGFGFNAIPNVTKVEVRSDPQPINQQSFDTHKQLQMNHSELKGQLKDIERRQNYNTYGLQTMAEYIWTKGLQGQNNPPPTNLSSIPSQSFRSPRVEEVDDTDRFGNIPSNDPFVDFQFDSQPIDETNLDTNAVDTQATDPTETQPADIVESIEPDEADETLPIDMNPQPSFDPSPQPTQQSPRKLNAFELMKESSRKQQQDALVKQQQDASVKKKRGRQPGVKNKPKPNPLTSEAIAESNNINTRRNHGELLNQNFETPNRVAKAAKKAAMEEKYDDDDDDDYDYEVYEKEPTTIQLTKRVTSKLSKLPVRTSRSGTTDIPIKSNTGVLSKITGAFTPKSKVKVQESGVN